MNYWVKLIYEDKELSNEITNMITLQLSFYFVW